MGRKGGVERTGVGGGGEGCEGTRRKGRMQERWEGGSECGVTLWASTVASLRLSTATYTATLTWSQYNQV